jgi:uncharacterized protein (DUF1330 family)
MMMIDIQNLQGTWSVITPSQVYEFPSHQLAQNFYNSLLWNLKR